MNPWYQSPQTWEAYGLEWRFEYSCVSAKRTVTAPGFTLDVKIADTSRFSSPQLWLSAWAKKNKKPLPSQEKKEAVPLELDLFPQVAPAALQVEVMTEYLTPEEERERLFLERKVERAFYQAGNALLQLRNRRLYRSTHKTFEEYCQDRFGYSRRKMDYLITGAEVFENLLLRTNGSQNEETETRTIGSQILPTSERQCRPLTQLNPEQQREAWLSAVESAGGKVPSFRIVKDIVQRIRERTRVPNPYRVGEVCQFIVKDNPELRGKGGCWCIVSEVHEFSCTVTTWEGLYIVRLEHLKSLDYSDSECQGMKGLCDRLARLYSEKLEETAWAILQSLGHLKRPYLTALEEKLLGLLAAECGSSPSVQQFPG